MIRIKFKTKEDSINGYYKIAICGIIRSLPKDVYEISSNLKEILDKSGIAYEILEGNLDKDEAIRNSLAVSI